MKLRKSLHRRISKSSKIKFSDKEIQEQISKINSRQILMCQPMGVALLDRPNHKSFERTSIKHFEKLEFSSHNLDTLEDLEQTISKKNFAQKPIPKRRKKFDYTFLNTLPVSPIIRTPAVGMKAKVMKLSPAPLMTRISVNQTPIPPAPTVPIIRRKSLFNKLDFDSTTTQTAKPAKKVVNKYQLGKVLGQGTYGKVFQCVDIQNKRIYAIKQFSKNDVRIKKYINREITIMKLLSHENIVKYVQNYESGKSQFIVMEHCGIYNLKAYVKQRVFLNQSQAKPVFRELVQAIKYLHQKLIVHRDLKLQNVLINQDEKVKLIDFGFSEQLQSENQQLFTYCGTPTYMSPEIIRKTPYNGFKSDCWALGIILYYMLIGGFPFVCRDQKTLFATILRTAVSIDSKFSLSLRNLLRGMLNPDQDQRYTIYEIYNHQWFK